MTCSTTSCDRPARWVRRLCCAACLFVASLPAVPAFAQGTAADRAIARSLFEQGRELMNGKRYAEACPKFEESQRLQPAGGTLLNLAVCHEHIGRTASAWTAFNDVATLSRQENKSEREQFARERVAALTPKLSRLTVTIPPQASDRAGLVVKVDSAVLGKAAWGSALPIDPGDHLVEVSAPRMKTWSTKVSVRPDAHHASVVVPALAEEPPAPLASPGAAATNEPVQPLHPVSPMNDSPQRDRASPDSTGSTRRTMAVVAGGVGLAGLVVGTVFGLRAKSKERESEDYCRPDAPSVCSQRGVDLIDEGRTSATISNVGFIAGGVGVVAGAVLWFTAPGQKTAAVAGRGRSLAVVPEVGASNATLLLRGSF